MPPPELPPPDDPDECDDELHDRDEPPPNPHDPPLSWSRELAHESMADPERDTHPSPQAGRESQKPWDTTSRRR